MAKLATAHGVGLSTMTDAEAVAQLGTLLNKARTPIRLHGTRVEEMFVYTAAAIGAVRAIKREETEDLVTTAPARITIPDFRLVLSSGAEILVEVKNIHERDPRKPRPLKVTYLKRLGSYGELFSRPVYLAVYWSAWRCWTLHNVNDLMRGLDSAGAAFSFAEAFRRSEMHILGDALLGTRYPLTLHFNLTSEVLRRRSQRSEQLIRIDSVKMSVAGHEIRNKRDKNIAFGLMLHGGWEEAETVTMDQGRVAAVEYSFSPPGTSRPDDFAPVAALSSLASSQFNDLTVSGSSIERLRPQGLPAPPYPRVSEGYHGVDLPLWVLILKSETNWACASIGATS